MACILLMLWNTVAVAGHADVFTGPFTLRQALTFYVVNESGSDFSIQLRWQDEAQVYADRPLLVRVFDPEENLIVRQERLCQRISELPAAAHAMDLQVTARGSGVYQVAITAFGGELEFSTTPVMSFGLFGHPRLAGRADQFASAFIYLPPGLEHLPIRSEEPIDALTLRDEAGAVKLELGRQQVSGQVTLPPGGEHVWELSIRAPGPYRLDFAGLPIILCPNVESARAIRASVEVLKDGTICFHQFQSRIHDVLRHYRAMQDVAFALRLPPLEQFASAWLQQPARNELLLGPYGVYAALPATLAQQNLDRTSPWFGTIDVWRQAAGSASVVRRDNIWASYNRLGMSRVAESVAVMAAVYSINEPFNPLYRDPALRNRIIIASLQELMLLREYEMPDAHVPDNYFGGERAFTFSSFLRSFPLVVHDCPADVRALWTQGLRRYVDHESISQTAITANQWSAGIKGLQHFADGTGEQAYFDLVQRHIHWLLTRNQFDRGQQPAGYFDESGPDATYVGITLHHLAWIHEQWNRSERVDPDMRRALLESMRRCIDLFNHTLAPQPDGTIVGATSFNVRTPKDWSQPQWGGGLAMLADDLAEATPLASRVWPTQRRLPRTASDRAALQQIVRGRLQYLGPADFTTHKAAIAAGPDIFFTIWEHFASVHRAGMLPMVAQRTFVRNFGDEFFCVKRPGYYAFIYAGASIPLWQQDKRPDDPRRQHPRNAGGLAMLWSPMFGTSLLAQNWSAYAAHTIIAEHPPNSQREADWEDYWSVGNQFNVERATAVVHGRLRDQPISFERRYHFSDEFIACELDLSSDRDVAYRAMWECFPVAGGAENVIITLLDDRGQPLQGNPQQQRGNARAIAFLNSTREAHLVIFSRPRHCEIGPDHATDAYGQQHVYRRVLAALPHMWKAGQRERLTYRVQVVPTSRIASTVRQAAAQMQPQP